MIGIIILSFNDSEYTEKCIKSIGEKTKEEYEIILVNNGCDAQNTERLEKLEYDYYIKNNENEGVVCGTNQGVLKAIELGHGYVCLINSDCEVRTDGWLGNMRKVLDKYPSAGIVSAMTNKIANRLQVVKSERELPMKSIKANWVGTGMTLMPADIFAEVGFFDEKLGMGTGMDAEFCLRLKEHGYDSYIAGNTFVWHKGHVGYKKMGANFRKLQKENKAYIKRKYPSFWRLVMK